MKFAGETIFLYLEHRELDLYAANVVRGKELHK